MCKGRECHMLHALLMRSPTDYSWPHTYLLTWLGLAQVIRRDAGTGAATLLIRVTVDKGIAWEGACQEWQAMRGAAAQSRPADANGSAQPRQPGQADGQPLCACKAWRLPSILPHVRWGWGAAQADKGVLCQSPLHWKRAPALMCA